MRNSSSPKKHPFLSLSAKLGAICLALFGFSAAGVGVYGLCEKQNYDGCYNYKLSLLQEAHRKGVQKAVFVGGSATNFGIRADYFEAQTGIRSINMGFSAGRSFDAYLNAIKPYLDSGDHLFLLPEPGYWGGSFHKVDSETVLFEQHNARSSISIQSPADLWNYVTGWISNGWTGWADSTKFLAKKVSIDNLHLGSWTIYDKWECNENGDFTLSQEGAKQEFSPSAISYPLSSQFAKELGEYVRKELPDVHAYIVAAPHDEGCDKDPDTANQAFANYESVSGLPCLLKPTETSFDHSCLLDTQYHLDMDSAFVFAERVLGAFLKM